MVGKSSHKMLSSTDFIALAKLALSGKESDIRLYLAKQVRKIREKEPETSKKLEELLKKSPSQTRGVMRRAEYSGKNPLDTSSEDEHGKPPLLKHSDFREQKQGKPLLEPALVSMFDQVVKERERRVELEKLGLKPCSSLVFEGPPGVGKTISAAWLAAQLDLPFYTLDLTAVMSSYLGRSGSNLRSVLEYAKSHPCVLFLDEIDAIAKKRSDEADVGELKRLVTIMLQEIEDWPSDGLLIAATNHPEIVDPALWRRFDLVVKFPLPSVEQTKKAIDHFMGDDRVKFERVIEVLADSLSGSSYSDIKREVTSLRKKRILEPNSTNDSLLELIIPKNTELDKTNRVYWAVKLVKEFGFTQVKSSEVMRVSRDTIRKHLRNSA